MLPRAVWYTLLALCLYTQQVAVHAAESKHTPFYTEFDAVGGFLSALLPTQPWQCTPVYTLTAHPTAHPTTTLSKEVG
jgi:hypothetical protein